MYNSFGVVTKFNKKDYSVDIKDFYGREYERVPIPGSYSSKEGVYKGRIQTIKKGQLVLFAEVNDYDYVVVNFYSINLRTNQDNYKKFISSVVNDFNPEDDYVDYQEGYLVLYKKDKVQFIEIKEEKTFFEIIANSNYKVSIGKDKIEISKNNGFSSTRVFSFDPKTAKLEIENSGKKVSFDLSGSPSLATIGGGSMNVVNTKELKDWMEKTQKAIQGIIDAIKGGTAVPQDGGASLKSSISAKLTNEPPKVPSDIDNTNIKIDKKGS